jgi:hypothetical protein
MPASLASAVRMVALRLHNDASLARYAGVVPWGVAGGPAQQRAGRRNAQRPRRDAQSSRHRWPCIGPEASFVISGDGRGQSRALPVRWKPAEGVVPKGACYAVRRGTLHGTAGVLKRGCSGLWRGCRIDGARLQVVGAALHGGHGGGRLRARRRGEVTECASGVLCPNPSTRGRSYQSSASFQVGECSLEGS